MLILCRIVGHAVSRRSIKFDPVSFHLHGRCKRCGEELVREGDRPWAAATGEAPGKAAA